MLIKSSYDIKTMTWIIFAILLLITHEISAKLPANFEIFGPGLSPSIVLPARYFFIKPLDKNGNL